MMQSADLRNRDNSAEGGATSRSIGEFRSVAEDVVEEQRQDANHAHFTASEKVNHGLETVATASKPSIRKFFVDKANGISGMDADGIFGMDSQKTSARSYHG